MGVPMGSVHPMLIIVTGISMDRKAAAQDERVRTSSVGGSQANDRRTVNGPKFLKGEIRGRVVVDVAK
jgi:hypothetical protein